METLLQKACRIMMTFRPCTIIFRDGREIRCDCITETGVTVVGRTIGSITVTREGRSERLVADYIRDIREDS